MESEEEAVLLGRIAVHHKFITLEQLAEATRERGRLGKKLGVVLLEKGMLDELALGKILALQQRHLKQLERQKPRQRAQEPERRRAPTPKEWVHSPPGDRLPTPPRRLRRDLATPARGDDPGAARPARGRTRPTSPDGPPPTSKSPRQHLSPPPSGSQAPPDSGEPEGFSAGQRGSTATQASRPARTPTNPQLAAARHTPTADEKPAGKAADTLIDELGERKSTLRAPEDDTVPADALSWDPGDELDPPSSEQPLEPRASGHAPPPTKRVEQLNRLLTHAARSLSTDVHVSPGNAIRMRVQGQLVPLTDQPIAAAATEAVLREMLTDWQRRKLDADGEVDFAYSLPGVGRFRASVYRMLTGLGGVFHYLPETIPTLSSLGLPASLAKLTNFAQGLVLLTGPAGSGKTSTLAALLNILNTERRDHILTIEDPIEYVHQSKRCVVNQRQVGRHTTSFARALRAALREDPDIICIGELRDLETISLALSAAETGHLVLGTLHTGNAIGTITRIVGAFPPNQQSQIRSMMSESLRAVISQRLLPRSDGNGVVPALEILYVNKAVGALIRDNRAFQIRSVLQTGRAHGMQLLDASLSELVSSGWVSREAALPYCEDPKVLGAG